MFSPFIPAGFPWLCAALVNYHAGLYPEAAEPLVAASGLHTQKPRCSTAAITAASTAAAAVHPQRWVYATTRAAISPERGIKYNIVLKQKTLVTSRVLVVFPSDFGIDHVQPDVIASECAQNIMMIRFF